MKLFLTLSIPFFIAAPLFSQDLPAEYKFQAHKADSLYKAGDYKNSALSYSAAFKANGWIGQVNDRYNAACSWTLAGYPDSAFYQLERITQKAFYGEYDHVIADPDLHSLHGDARWQPLVKAIRENKERMEAKLNKPLVRELDSIYRQDQEPRRLIDSMSRKYGPVSPELQPYIHEIERNDSVNLVKVLTILDKYGWPGYDMIGGRGSLTLFLVIQHAPADVQKKYLPLIRDAVKNRIAMPAWLALLEDRVALGEGKKQIYGSQVTADSVTGKYYLLPIEDEKNVNKRRTAVGLNSLEEYAKGFGIDYVPPKNVPPKN